MISAERGGSKEKHLGKWFLVRQATVFLADSSRGRTDESNRLGHRALTVLVYPSLLKFVNSRVHCFRRLKNADKKKRQSADAVAFGSEILRDFPREDPDIKLPAFRTAWE